MKWKTGFVLVLVMLAVASIGVTNVFGHNITADELNITADELWNNLTMAVDNVTSVTYDKHLKETYSEGTWMEDYSHVVVDYVAEKRFTVSEHPDHSPCNEWYDDGGNKYYRHFSRENEMWGEWEKDYSRGYHWFNKADKRFELRTITPPMYIKILGSEELNGEDCWLVELERSQLHEPMKEVKTEMWISKNDYLPRLSVKKDIWHAEIGSWDIGTMRRDTTTQFYDYNKPANIQEPPGLPTPTPTPASPGFGVVFAIAGLLTVGYLIRRRNKNNRRC